MTEAAVSFAGNLTDQPEVRYTENGIARAMFRVAVSAGGSRRRRSSPWSCGATRPSMPRSR
jgi:single-stranded DNA-binding protein